MYIEDEDINSGANFRSLQKECFQLCNRDYTIKTNYPNIGLIATEFENKDIKKQDLESVARIFGRNKILLIKEIRTRYKNINGDTMSLADAKAMADGIFRKLGWE